MNAYHFFLTKIDIKEYHMINRTQSLIGFFAILLMAFSFSVHAGSVKNLFQNNNDPYSGNRHGKITIVEFFDYQCSHCISMAPALSAIIEANPDVRIVYKEFPIRGDISNFASRAALAANKQGKYEQFHNALLKTNLDLTQQTILDIAKTSGLNLAKLQKDMDSPNVYNQLSDNAKLAQEKQVTGTPAFFIGKTNAENDNDIRFILGEMSQSELQEAINNAKKS
jgi:protein-disulfide isomerase